MTTESVFARKEMKYCLDARQRTALMAAAAEHLRPTEYGASQIRSLYYDTPDSVLIERSLDKPFYKEKLRLRGYFPLNGTVPAPDPAAEVFVEIKKKFKGIVYKRRVPMTLAAAMLYLNGAPYEEACVAHPLPGDSAEESLAPRSLQISREIDFFLERYAPLAPSMLIVCDRYAFAGEDDLRLTFDVNLKKDATATDLAGNGLTPIIGEDESILEIKSAAPLPRWLLDALNDARAYPQSFSKYGTAYLTQCQNEDATPEPLQLPTERRLRA